MKVSKKLKNETVFDISYLQSCIYIQKVRETYWRANFSPEYSNINCSMLNMGFTFTQFTRVDDNLLSFGLFE